MGIPWDGMGWDRHNLLWDGMGWDRKICPMDKPEYFYHHRLFWHFWPQKLNMYCTVYTLGRF